MSDLPAPPVAPDADMRGLQFMPLDVVRLMDSDLYALSTGDEFKAAVSAWCKSWVQVPAGSLPDDDRILAHLTGAGKRWAKVKAMALRGFVRCSDGRLYHPVVCEKVNEAWAMRQRQRERSASGNAKRWGWGKSSPGDPRGDAAGDPGGDPHGDAGGDRAGHATGDPTWDRKGQGQGQGQRKEPSGERSETAIPALRAPPEYAFRGEIIRLTDRDFAGWERNFGAIPDLRAELATIDAKLVAEDFQGKWFGRVAAWLRKRHETLLRQQPEAPETERDQWRTRLAVWSDPARGGPRPERWVSEAWGPPPGHPGCRAPPELLAEFRHETIAGD